MSQIELLIREVSELKQIVQGIATNPKEPRHRWLTLGEFMAATGWTKDRIRGIAERNEYAHLRRERVGVGYQYDYHTWKQLFQ